MTTPELPPLPPFCITAMGHQWLWSEEVQARDDAREARERILLDRIAEAEGQRGQWAGLCARLEARIAELEADAERYRWLRDGTCHADDDAPVVALGTPGDVMCLVGDELDAAIDAARKA